MDETLIETTVTYTLEFKGRFYVIEGVPAKVCRETGEQLFSPETVERIRQTILGSKRPVRTIETPVYKYA